MKKFDLNKFIKIIKKSKDSYDSFIPNILDKVFDWKKSGPDGITTKYTFPKNLNSLHKFFKKIDKKIKYETVFNVYDDLRQQKAGEWFFELGIISHQTNKKLLFICVYFYATRYDEVTFDIVKKPKLNKYPDRIKLMKIVHQYLDGKYFPKTTTDESLFDEPGGVGQQINGAWGSVVNFSYKLELKPQKTVSHPLYDYSLLHRYKIERSFISYPDTKINYEFGKKRK